MKAKKLLAFLLVSTLLIGMFGFTASAEVTNPNDGNWYKFNLRDIDGDEGEERFKVASIKYDFTGSMDGWEHFGIYFSIASRNWWGGADYAPDNLPSNIVITANSITYSESKPLLEDFDTHDAVPFFFGDLSGADITVTNVTCYDVNGNQVYPAVAAAAASSSSSSSSSAKTSDNSLIALFGVLFVVSTAGLFVLRRKQNSH